jgi:hypothetical protein
MYNDFRDTQRDRWRFTYTGKQLLPHAEKRQMALHAQENDLRKQIQKLMGDKSQSVTGEKAKRLENAAVKAATQAEQFDVFVHEFTRNPDKEFTLSVSDVVFFGIVGKPADDCKDYNNPDGW